MDEGSERDDAQERQVLECWFPLAQQLNRELGWDYDALTLALLVRLAADELVQVDTVIAARAVLWRRSILERRPSL